MVQYLAAATAPINNVFWSATDNKYLNVNVRDTGAKIATSGSSDHASFNKVGIPGFFWDEEGRADYSYGWHTQNDKYELGVEEYLRQSATSAAVTAYNLACAPNSSPAPPCPPRPPPSPTAPSPPSRKPRPPTPSNCGTGCSNVRLNCRFIHNHDLCLLA